jgi:hypothetical protein
MVNLLVRDTVLFGDPGDPGQPGQPGQPGRPGQPGGADGTGWVEDYGPVPGDLIRQWIADNLDPDDAGDLGAWLRRVYEQPETGDLVAMDSKATFFHGRLAEFLRLRDRRCRHPYCDARIRHADHIQPRAEGGPTTAANGQSLCEPCNHAKQAPGWTARPRPGPRHTVATTTPTGHTYTSTAEPL